MDDSNPYEAPRAVAAGRPGASGGWRRLPWRSLGWWGVVFVANLPVPVLFGSSTTDQGGLAGMAAAVAAMAVLGGVLCARSRRVGLAMIVGGAAVALSQAMPLLHIIAGTAGMAAGSAAGVVTLGGGPFGEVVGPVGGALVTIVTGALLMGAAATVGLVLQVVTPGRWWGLDPWTGRLD